LLVWKVWFIKLYCPKCWETNEWGAQRCARCGASLHSPEGETYVQKLIWALHHKEATTALRAATILGDLRASKATVALAEVLGNPSTDPYLGAAAARSLGSIGDPRSRETLIDVLEHAPLPVRLAAVEALEALGPEEEAAQALRRASQDKSPNVSADARRVLEGWGD
jgi:HEAT repeat protein